MEDAGRLQVRDDVAAWQKLFQHHDVSVHGKGKGIFIFALTVSNGQILVKNVERS